MKKLLLRKRIILFGLVFVLLLAGLYWYINMAYQMEGQTAMAEKAKPAHTKVITEEKMVYITVDTALGADYTADILSVLDKKGIKASFALLGVWVEQNEALTKQIITQNHGIMSHTMTHPHYDSMDAAALVEDATKAEALIQTLTGKPCLLIRPPYQTCSLSTSNVLIDAGFIPILFSVDAQDYTGIDPATIASKVVAQIKPGDIVVFQNNNAMSAPAIGMVVDQLKELNYTFGVLNSETFS